MNFAGAFAGFAAAFPGVWIDAEAQWSGDPALDDGGSIVTPGTPQTIACKVQFDAVTEAMRRDADFKEKDMRLLILRDGLARVIDTQARVIVDAGDNAGTWSLRSVVSDPAGIGYECRGRK
jgi:hypothetical protein